MLLAQCWDRNDIFIGYSPISLIFYAGTPYKWMNPENNPFRRFFRQFGLYGNFFYFQMDINSRLIPFTINKHRVAPRYNGLARVRKVILW
jgi:hypothetical protein